jgi:hypothetical protein
MQEAKRRQYYEEQKSDKNLDEAIDKAIRQLSEKTRRDLKLID